MPKPTRIPATTTIIKSNPASSKTNLWVTTAAKAKRNTIKLAASLTRLSPSKISTTRLGILNFSSTEVAAIASGGEMIPPNKKPKAKEKPGINRWATMATAQEVKMTRPKAKNQWAYASAQKSFQEVFQAAE